MGRERLWHRLLRWLGFIETVEVDQTQAKAEMCKNAVASGVCPNDCEHCAWCITRSNAEM